jgi:hypothetical protein
MANDNARPAYDAFVVDGEGEDAFWTKIGAAWPHQDGRGFSLQLVALPVGGRITLRVPKEREKGDAPADGVQTRSRKA